MVRSATKEIREWHDAVEHHRSRYRKFAFIGLVIALFFASGTMMYSGYAQFWLGLTTPRQATDFELDELLTVTSLPSSHLRIGQHIAAFDWGYGSGGDDFESGYYYPIISVKYLKDMRQLDEVENGPIMGIDESRKKLMVQQSRFLVKSQNRGATWTVVPELTGVVVKQLPEEDHRFISNQTGITDPSSLFVIHEGYQPGFWGPLCLVLGSLVLFVVAVGLMIPVVKDLAELMD